MKYIKIRKKNNKIETDYKKKEIKYINKKLNNINKERFNFLFEQYIEKEDEKYTYIYYIPFKQLKIVVNEFEPDIKKFNYGVISKKEEKSLR